MEKIIPLNIVTTYPVRWGKYQVIRDFVQNFYDAIGYLDWKEKFHFDFVDNTLSIWADEITFSYEWLLHIGASTKTACSEKYAGYFGEGFKISSFENGAVYLRSREEIPTRLPVVADYGRRGAVFCGYQMLSTNPFGLVVCLHRYTKQDRERRTLYSFEVIDVFKTIAYYIDSYGAMIMLEKMRRYWNSVPCKRLDIHSWNGVINTLIYCTRKEFIQLQTKIDEVKQDSGCHNRRENMFW